MRRWYEPKKDTPGIEKNAPKKKGVWLFLEILWREFFPLIKLNLLFLLTCLPIITIPAALTASSRITTTMVRDCNYFMWTDYWDAFKRDFGKSLAGGLILGAALALFGLSSWFYYMLSQVAGKLFMILAGCSVCMLLTAYFAALYFFPMMAMVELPVMTMLKNAVILAYSQFKRTLPAAVITLALGVVSVGLFPYSSFYTVCIGCSLAGLISNFFIVKPIETVILGIVEEEPKPQEETPVAVIPEEFPEWEDTKGE